MSTKIYTITAIAAAGAFFASTFFNASSSEREYSPKKSLVFEQAIGTYDVAIEYNKLLKGELNTGHIDPKAVYAARKNVNQVRNNKAEPMGLIWNHLGPINVAGRTRSLAVDRNNTDVLMSGGVGGGVYISINGGDTWWPKMLPDNNLIASISQSANGSYFIGTGPALDDWSGSSNPSSDGSDNILGDGIWRTSSIYGEYEHVLDAADEPSFRRITRVVSHPTNPDVLFVGTFSGGLNISRNATASTLTFEGANGLSAGRVVDVVLSPDGTTVLAASGSNGGSAELWRSVDGGNNFTKVLTINGGVRAELAMSPSDGNYAYAAVTNSVSGGCLHSIWQTSDGGATWNKIADGDPNGGTTNTFDPYANPGTNCQGQYDNAIAVFPDNPGKIIVGGVQLWQGVQQPNSNPPLFGWTQIAITGGGPSSVSPAYVHADKHVIRIPTASKVYVGSDGGIGKSKTAGASWTQNNYGYNTSQFYSLAIAPQSLPGVEIAMGGTQDNGTLLTGFPIPNAGNDPREAFQVQGGDGFDAEISRLNLVSFATSQNGALRRYDGSNFNSGDFFDAELGAACETDCGPFYTATELWETDNAAVTFDSVMFYADKNYSSGDTIRYESPTGSYPIFEAIPSNLSQGDSILMPDRVQSKFVFANISTENTGSGLWLTRDACNLTVTVPEWSKVAGAESYPDNFNGESAFQVEFSSDGNHMFFGTTSGNLYRVSNLNYAYDSLTSDIRSSSCVLTLTRIVTSAGGNITGVAIDPNDADNLVFSVGGYKNAGRVYRLTDAASTVDESSTTRDITGDLPDGIPALEVEIDVEDKNIVLLGTQFGVFATKEAFGAGQVEWAEENLGMPRLPVYEIKQQTVKTTYNAEFETFVPALNYKKYYIATHGGGFFTTGSLVGVPKIKDGDKVTKANAKLYPNPVRSNSTLEFDLAASAQTRIRIFDLKGQLIRDIDMGNLPIGKQRVNLNTSNLSVGTYIVNMTSGNVNEVVKFIKSE